MKLSITLFVFLSFFNITVTALSQVTYRNNLFKNQSCEYRTTVMFHLYDPPYEKWPYDSYEGAYVVKYNNRLSITLNFRAGHSVKFDETEMTAYINWCKSYWASQCTRCTPGIIWQEVNEGAEFYWSVDPLDISTQHGLCLTAISPASTNEMVAVSDCGQEVINGMSEILLNNTDNYFRREDYDRYWTTDPGFIFDEFYRAVPFQYYFLHEMGHYLGLAHDITGIMVPGGWEEVSEQDMKNPRIAQCDADRFRKLYCEECMGHEPVWVEPNYVVNYNNPEEISLEIFPNPVVTNYFSINYTLIESGLTLISMFDHNGRFIRNIAGELQNEGEHTYPYPVFDLPTGQYFIILNINNKKYTMPVSIIK